MVETLGKKMICQECGTRFFDMGKSKAKCPRCGGGSVMNLETAILKSRPKEILPPVVEPEEETSTELEDEDTEESETDELTADEGQFGDEEEEEEMDNLEDAEDSYEADEL